MRCLVHIGIEKTGSTALQRVLRDNRNELSQKGVYYGKSGGTLNSRAIAAGFVSLDRSDDYLAHRGMVDSERRLAWRRGLFESTRRDIGLAERGHHKLYVLSSEHFSSRLSSREEVSNLVSFLRQDFDDISIVCYLRRQDALAVSRFSQALRAGYVAPRLIPEFQKNSVLPDYYDFEGLLDRWATAIGSKNVEVKVYEPGQLVGGNTVSDFLEDVLKVDLGVGHDVRANISLNEDAQIALQMFNVCLGQEMRGPAMRARRQLVAFLEAHALGQGKQPARHEAKKFYAKFKVANNRVAMKFLNREKLFSEDFDCYPKKKSDPSWGPGLSLLSDYFSQQFSANRFHHDADGA